MVGQAFAFVIRGNEGPLSFGGLLGWGTCVHMRSRLCIDYLCRVCDYRVRVCLPERSNL